MTGSAQYIKHLYGEDLDGYIQVAQINENKVIKIKNTQQQGIREVIQEFEGEPDSYITPNSFYKPERSNENIRHFRALYIDLDLVEYEKTEAFYQLYMITAKGLIPKPSMIIASGRGLHLYWRIEHAPKGASYTWQELEDYLYKHLKTLGADIKATDAARLLRIPGTINSKNGAACEVLEVNEYKYSMYELRGKYLDYKPKQQEFKQLPKRQNVHRLFNSYTLHIARAQDIEILCKLRDYKVEGYRNSLLYCYTYWKGVTTREPEALESITSGLNDKFIDPLKKTEVKAIVRSTSKAVEKFIDYEQGIRSGESKRVSKGMRDKGGYWYTNDRLIEMLNITEAEQQKLKTIIGSKEKNRRKNKQRYEDRRNENGLTAREQAKANNLNQALELIKEGYTQAQAADIMGMTQQNISYLLNNK